MLRSRSQSRTIEKSSNSNSQKEVSERREREFANKVGKRKVEAERRECEFADEARKRKSEVEEHERELARKTEERDEEEAHRDANICANSIYFKCSRKRLLISMPPLLMVPQRHRDQSCLDSINSEMTSTLTSSLLNDSPRVKTGL